MAVQHPSSVRSGWSVLVGLARQGQHPVERDLRPLLGLLVDLDLVDHQAVDERLHRPDEVGEVDAVHRRAVADGLVEEDDPLVGVLGGQPLHEVELGADRPGRAGRRGLDGLDDELRRADQVGLEDDLVRALGVHQDLDAGDGGAQVVDGVLGEAAVHRAVALPEDHLRVAQLLGGEPAVRAVRVPDHAVVEREAHLQHGGVAAEVLVGQEQHLRALLEGPLQRGLGVGGRADGAAVAAAERLDVGAGVHVRDRDDVVGDAGLLHRGPGVLDLPQAGHVGHRAAGAPGRAGSPSARARSGCRPTRP